MLHGYTTPCASTNTLALSAAHGTGERPVSRNSSTRAWYAFSSSDTGSKPPRPSLPSVSSTEFGGRVPVPSFL